MRGSTASANPTGISTPPQHGDTSFRNNDPSSPIKHKAEFPRVDVSREADDFYWADTMVMHHVRQREMMKKYGPQINKLMGVDPWTKWVVIAVNVMHIAVAVYASQHLSGLSYFLCAYFVGGTLAQNLFLSVHEVTHYLAFKTKKYNDWLAIFTNIPMILPWVMPFKQHHHNHHRYLGWDGKDPDVASYVEAKLFQSVLGKLFFLTFQIYFYAARPTLMAFPINKEVVLNFLVIACTNCIMYSLWGVDIFIYFALSATMGLGLNPLSGHFIAEHYIRDPTSYQETFSYYGALNAATWNIGYHNEHHDFPNIPAAKLPLLQEIAPEYYKNLDTTDSWVGAQLQFLFDPKVNLYCRMKRERGAGTRKGKLVPTTHDTVAW